MEENLNWPSLAGEDLNQPLDDPQYALQQMVEKEIFDFDGIKRYINYVLLIQLSYLEFASKNKEAQQQFDSFFSKKDPMCSEQNNVDFGNKIVEYIQKYVEPYQQLASQQSNEEGDEASPHEQQYQMLFAAMAIMFRVLKIIRVQDHLPTQQHKYLFAAACICVAANCDYNYNGKPLYPKSVSRAAFIAQMYFNVEHALQTQTEPEGLMSYTQWSKLHFDHYIHMHSAII